MYCMICKENRAGGDGLCVKCRFKMNTQNKDVASDLEILLPEGRYVGKARNGIPNGKGELTYNEHDSRKYYKGDFKDGMRHGKGKLVFRNDAYYDGEWANDKYEGYGEESLPGGNNLEGYYTAGRLTSGHVYFGDGREYEGEWSDDMPNGNGKMYWRDGHAEEGYWVNGICAFRETPTEEQIAQFLAEQEQRSLEENPLEDEADQAWRQQNTELPPDETADNIWNPLVREELAAVEEDESAPLLFDGMEDSPNILKKTSQRAEPTKKSVARPVFRGNGFDGTNANGDLEDEADALAKRMAEAAAQTLVVLDDSVSDIDLSGGVKAPDFPYYDDTEEAGETNENSDAAAEAAEGTASAEGGEPSDDAGVLGNVAEANGTEKQDNEGNAEMIESSFVDTSDDRKDNANSKILSGMYESIGKPIPEELREKKVVEPKVSEKTLEDRAMQSLFAKMGMVAAPAEEAAGNAEAAVNEAAASVETAVAEVAKAAETTAAAAVETVAETAAETAAEAVSAVEDNVAASAEEAASAAEAVAEAVQEVEKKPYDPVTKTGYHEETYANGEHYVGDFVNGKRHGIGRMEYLNGDVYEGSYNMGKRHGQGIMTYAAGSRYEGNWENSIKSGQGRFVQANGEVYEGSFEGGTFEGTGSYMFSNGNTYIGSWKGGKRDGTGVLIYANGAKEAQVWEGGKKVFAEIVDDPAPAEEQVSADNAAETAAETVVEGARAFTDTTEENVAETVQAAVENAAENAAETAQAAVENAAENAAETAQAAVENAAENAAETTQAAVENAAENAAEAAQAAVENVAENAAENTAETAQAAVENAAETAAEAAAVVIPELMPVRETKSINYKSGNRYEGEVDEKNMPHGNGVFTYTNGSSYEGEFEHGVRNGYGIFRWATGDSYEGGWKNDKRHGEGVMKYANGRVRKGRFENNEYVGI